MTYYVICYVAGVGSWALKVLRRASAVLLQLRLRQRLPEPAVAGGDDRPCRDAGDV